MPLHASAISMLVLARLMTLPSRNTGTWQIANVPSANREASNWSGKAT